MLAEEGTTVERRLEIACATGLTARTYVLPAPAAMMRTLLLGSTLTVAMVGSRLVQVAADRGSVAPRPLRKSTAGLSSVSPTLARVLDAGMMSRIAGALVT